MGRNGREREDIGEGEEGMEVRERKGDNYHTPDQFVIHRKDMT